MSSVKSFLSIFSRAMRPRPVSPLRAVLAFWLLVMTPFAVAGCGSSAAKARSTLRLPLYGWPSSPDPALVNGESERLLAGMLYSGLVKFSPDLHVIPDLAVSIPTISLDGRSYVFTIRQDARFTDGSHCRASDVAFSLSRALSPDVDSAPARKLLGNIVGARQVE